ncbi:hypothetical protein DA075_04585 [Methylobacterium currus]|uniref:Uncharacterized protein n=1 Tax=Methylobacterium currus TaxID=2051553 RepID=A0A2R4WFJ4_9HYPH|nr:hypothetical protein [Methylobacterium currus]AWB20301.1 hypothetical protein DA075_04585 [Methylobacterium currus]
MQVAHDARIDFMDLSRKIVRQQLGGFAQPLAKPRYHARTDPGSRVSGVVAQQIFPLPAPPY